MRESGTVVPLLPNAAPAPQRPSRAGAGDASHSVTPKTTKFGGGPPPHLKWVVSRRAPGGDKPLAGPVHYRSRRGSMGQTATETAPDAMRTVQTP